MSRARAGTGRGGAPVGGHPGPGAAENGSLYLIHTNISPNPMLARVCGLFGLNNSPLIPGGADAAKSTG
jgi:hypothetical protein